jgi:hypothetical protein
MKRPLARFLLACACLAAASGPAPSLAQTPPSFAGSWTLNRSLSDDLEAKVLEATGGSKTVGQSAQEGKRVELRRIILGILPALGRLEVEQTAQEIKLVDAEDNVRIFYFGREHTRQSRLGSRLRCTTEWQGEQLVVTETSDQGKLIEILTAVPARRQLLHVLRLQHSALPSPLEVKLAYDAAGAAAGRN